MKEIIFKLSIILAIVISLASCNRSRTGGKDTLAIDSLSDDSLLTLVQYQTFRYFWDGAEPFSGMARERFHVDNIYPENDKNTVAVGGSGFGIMAILTGIERKFITRRQGFERLRRIADYLKKADRFHGAWPHWLFGETGKVKPFGQKDNGGDIVETAYLVQGLLCARQYFLNGTTDEKNLSVSIDSLWRGVEWDWYRNGGKNVLYWHWSPEYAWQMNFPIEGYNECLITYVLAASSPTHTVPAAVYRYGWARKGGIRTDVTTYGYHLTLKHNFNEQYGGPLFWSHYSYLGLDPRGLKDAYADYWEQNLNHVLINRRYCIENPKKYQGYGPGCWGLTASYSVSGYAAHCPNEDPGVISPTAALSSFPYTPEYSMDVLKNLYYNHKEKLWGPYGFYDAFSIQKNWYIQRYLAIDQGPIVAMIENYRSGLFWTLFMSCTEVRDGLKKLGFESPHLSESNILIRKVPE
jgi:hypothetical protein